MIEYMIWYDMIWCDMIWHDMIWYDMIYTMLWYDEIFYDMTSCDTEYDMTLRYWIWYIISCGMIYIYYNIRWHDCISIYISIYIYIYLFTYSMHSFHIFSPGSVGWSSVPLPISDHQRLKILPFLLLVIIVHHNVQFLSAVDRWIISLCERMRMHTATN